MKRSIQFLSLIALVSLVVVGCKPSGSGSNGATGGQPMAGGRAMPDGEGNKYESGDIKLGLIASLTGELQPWGEDSKRGVELAVEEFNKAGGLDGKMVRLIVEDSASKPESGKSATQKLIGEDGVLAVIGEVSSGITIQAADVAQETGVPLVAVGATRVDLTEKGAAIFRACFTDNFQGAAMARFAYDDLGLRNVAVMTDKKQPYSVGLSDVFKKAFVSFGGKIATEEFYEQGNIDFKAQLTNIKSVNPDGLFCSGYFNEVGPIARQRESIGLNVPMIGGDGWDSTQLIASGGTGILGGYFLNHYHNSDQRKEVQDFVRNFRAKYKQPPATAMGALGYDAALITLDALKRAKSLDSRALMIAIQETKGLKGVSGDLTIGEDGNAQKPAHVLKVEKDGFVHYKQIPFFVFKE
jgi:branched-chain amino acid transport system substrate-binding protein